MFYLNFLQKWVTIEAVIFSWGGNLLEKKKIERINALAKKAKTVGLTDAETAERDALRREYLDAIRQNFKQTLDSIEIIDKGE